MTAYVDETMRQNEDFTSETFPYLDTSGNPIDLTTATAVLNVRTARNLTSSLLLSLTQGAGITLGVGFVFYKVTAAQLLAISPSNPYYDLYVILVGGQRVDFISGRWQILGTT